MTGIGSSGLQCYWTEQEVRFRCNGRSCFDLGEWRANWFSGEVTDLIAIRQEPPLVFKVAWAGQHFGRSDSER
jgi:hypothetical protein